MLYQQINHKFRSIGILLAVILLSIHGFGQSPKKHETCGKLSEQPIERQMRGAAMHCYQIELPKDHFFQVRVERNGIEVVLKFIDPNGKVISEVDSSGAQGFENLSLISSEAGVYRLEITRMEASSSKGSYKIFRDALRIATDTDRKQVEAQIVFGQAQNKAESSPQTALTLFKKAEELFRAASDQTGEAKASVEEGLLFFSAGDKNSALTFFKKALTLFNAVSNKGEAAKVLKFIGIVYSSAGDDRLALESWEKAEPLFQDADKMEKVDMLQGMGNAYLRLTELSKAQEKYTTVLAILDKESKPDEAAEKLKVWTKSNLGIIYLELRQRKKALDEFNKALDIARKKGFKQEEVVFLNNLGRAYDELGEKGKALENFELALSKADKKQRPSVLLSAGKVYFDKHDEEKALKYYLEALEGFRDKDNKDKFGESRTLVAIGRLYSSQGNKDEAIKYYNQALELHRSFGFQLGEAGVLSNLMSVWQSSGNRRLAIFYGKQSINMYQRIRGDLQKLDLELQRSFLDLLGDPYRMLAALLIEEGRTLEAQQVIGFLKEDELYEFTRRSPDSVSNVPRQLELSPDEIGPARKYQELAEKIIVKRRNLMTLELEKTATGGTTDKQMEAQKLLAEITDLKNEFAKFLESLPDQFPSKPTTITEPANLPTQIWQKKLLELGKGTVLLTTMLTENRYYVIITTVDSQMSHTIDVSRTELNEKIKQLQESMNDPRSKVLPDKSKPNGSTVIQDLYEILVKPIEEDLVQVKAKTLLWSLDGKLRYVPFAVLHDRQNYLIEKYASLVVTLVQPPENNQESPEGWSALVAGVSIKIHNRIGEFPSAPEVETLLRNVVRDESAKNPTEMGFFPGKRLLNREFTRKNFLASLKQKPQLVLLATHFNLVDGKDSDSFLLLGDGSKLSLADMRTDPSLDLNGVSLLVLAACNTAISVKEGNGVEIESLGVIAQKRGAKTVLASLWSIPSSGTAELMKEFFQKYIASKGSISKTEALRQAQISLLKRSEGTSDYNHPAHWGGVVALGNL